MHTATEPVTIHSDTVPQGAPGAVVEAAAEEPGGPAPVWRQEQYTQPGKHYGQRNSFCHLSYYVRNSSDVMWNSTHNVWETTLIMCKELHS